MTINELREIYDQAKPFIGSRATRTVHPDIDCSVCYLNGDKGEVATFYGDFEANRVVSKFFAAAYNYFVEEEEAQK